MPNLITCTLIQKFRVRHHNKTHITEQTKTNDMTKQRSSHKDGSEKYVCMFLVTDQDPYSTLEFKMSDLCREAV